MVLAVLSTKQRLLLLPEAILVCAAENQFPILAA